MQSLPAFLATACLTTVSLACRAQSAPSNPLAPYISVSEPVIALTHVEMIDGTGAAPVMDQTLVLDHGRIASVGPSSSAQIPLARRSSICTGTLSTPAWLACTSTSFM